MEWLETVGPLAAIVTFVTLFGAVHWLWRCYRNRQRRVRDRRRRINALFEPSGDRSKLKLNAPSRFLLEEYQIVGFHGREKEVKELMSWARSEIPPDKNVSIALVTGDLGRGKSRLARHLCELAKDWNDGTRITRLIPHGRRREEWSGRTWIAGFLKEDAEHGDFSLLMRQRRPMLLAINSAERRVEQLKKLVSAALAFDNRRTHPVRILLTARPKSKEEDWWLKLDSTFGNIKYPTNPFEGVKPIMLPPIEEDPAVKDRRQEFSHALGAFLEAFREAVQPTPRGIFATLSRVLKSLGMENKAESKIESQMSKSDIPKNLLRAENAEMQDIHLAALLVACSVAVDGEVNIEKLSEDLVRLEQVGWDQEVCKNFSDPALRRELEGPQIQRAIAWLATTDKPAKTDEEEVLRRLDLLPNFTRGIRENWDSVVKIAAELYPGRGKKGKEWWGGVPNFHATWLTCKLDRIIEEDMTKKQPMVVTGLSDAALDNLLRHLVRRVQHYGDKHKKALENAIRAGGRRGIVAAARIGEEVGDPVGHIATRVLSETNNVEAAREVSDIIGVETILLGELALAAVKILYRDATTASKAERAGQAHNLSVRLSALGRREEALKAVKEAVDIHRELAEAWPDEFLPDLARSLSNLSSCLLAFGRGRREEALKAVKEAVGIRRELAEAWGVFLPDLAMSLLNLSTCLSALGRGRREEALKAVKEAVDLLRSLAKARPDEFLLVLAMSLSNLGGCLSALERHEKALAADKEAVAICRDLEKVHPDRFRPGLARSLHNLGSCLFALGRREEALKAVEEAVGIRRDLAEARDVFLPDLVNSLRNLGGYLRAVGRYEEASRVIEEANNLT